MTYSSKVRASRFDMKIQKIEHNTVRKITKASIVDNQSLAGVDHLDLVSDGNGKESIARTLIKFKSFSSMVWNWGIRE